MQIDFGTSRETWYLSVNHYRWLSGAMLEIPAGVDSWFEGAMIIVVAEMPSKKPSSAQMGVETGLEHCSEPGSVCDVPESWNAHSWIFQIRGCLVGACLTSWQVPIGKSIPMAVAALMLEIRAGVVSRLS